MIKGAQLNRITPVLILCMLVFGCVGMLTQWSGGYSYRFSAYGELAQPFNALTDNWIPNTLKADCNLYDVDGVTKVYCNDNTKKVSIAIWGDSHAAALVPGIIELKESSSLKVVSLSAASCPPVLNKSFSRRLFCNDLNRYSFSYLKALNPDVLLVTFAYGNPSYLGDIAIIEKYFNETVSALKEGLPNTRIVIIGPTPRWMPSPQAAYIRKLILNGAKTSDGYAVPEKILRDYDLRLSMIAKQNDVAFISINNFLCLGDECLALVGNDNGEFTQIDYGHLSKAGSIYLINSIRDFILP